MTAHTAAVSTLAAWPDVNFVGFNPAVDTLQDYTQRNAATKGNRGAAAGASLLGIGAIKYTPLRWSQVLQPLFLSKKKKKKKWNLS